MFKKRDSSAYGLVFIQLFSKFAGLIRELLVANFFGTSVVFSDYLKLMTYGGIIGLFCSEGGLSANLMRKFTLMHKKDYSFSKIKRNSIIISFFIFCIVFFVQIFALQLLISTKYNFYYIIIVNSLASALVFYFNVGQIILIAKSKYKNMYKSNFYRSFIYVVILYPLIEFLGVLGLAFNRLISVTSQYFNTWRVVNSEFLKDKPAKIGLSYRDFNLWVFLTNNSIFLWFLIAKIYFSFIDGIDIIFIVYAYQLASSFDGVVIKSFSLYLLERTNNSDFNIKKTIYTVLILSFIGIALSFAFAERIIKLIFSLGSDFTESHYNSIYIYFISLLFLVCFNGITNLVFQKVFSKRREIQFKLSKTYVSISFIASLTVGVLSYINSFRLSFIYFLVGVLSFINIVFVIYILKNERNF